VLFGVQGFPMLQRLLVARLGGRHSPPFLHETCSAHVFGLYLSVIFEICFFPSYSGEEIDEEIGLCKLGVGIMMVMAGWVGYRFAGKKCIRALPDWLWGKIG
jgi:hypothetical protein